MSDNDKNSLEEAYKATRYQVTLSGRIAVIRVGARCRVLDNLLDEISVTSWVFITAYNPYSQPLPDDDNRHRQQLLESLLRAGKFRYFPGEGIGDSDEWPPEPSFLVPGMAQEKALAYGRVFDQNAIVYGERGGIAQLLFCAPMFYARY